MSSAYGNEKAPRMPLPEHVSDVGRQPMNVVVHSLLAHRGITMLNARLAHVWIFVLAVMATDCRAMEYTYEFFEAFPGAVYTAPYSFNDHGQIVGAVIGVDSVVPFVGSIADGFVPFELPNGGDNQPFGINNAGDIVGTTRWFIQPSQAFVRHADGTFEQFGQLASASDINNLGQIAFSQNTGTGYQVLHIREPNGEIREIKHPEGFEGLTAWSFNDLGQISGHTGNVKGFEDEQGFILDTRDGSFETFAYPGEKYTLTHKMNNAGFVVGRAFTDADNQIGFVRMPSGKFIQIAPPGGTLLDVLDINDRGQILGNFSWDGEPRTLGFIGTPVPEPGTFGIAGIAVPLALAFASRIRR